MKHLKPYSKFLNEDKVTKNPIKIGTKNEDVLTLQKNLEEMGFELLRFGQDSIFGYETLGATKSLLNLVKKDPKLKKKVKDHSLLEIDNEVSVEQQEMIDMLANDKSFIQSIGDFFSKMFKKVDKVNLLGKKEVVQNIDNPDAFYDKLTDICEDLKINPNHLLLVMWKESRIDPKAVNPISNATGLIQFMPKTAKGLGTTVQKLKMMSATEQLDYVYEYFKPYKGKLTTPEDLYLVTFYPQALGRDDDYIIGINRSDRFARLVADQNKIVDLNNDKKVTVGEFKDYVTKGVPAKWKAEIDKTRTA